MTIECYRDRWGTPNNLGHCSGRVLLPLLQEKEVQQTISCYEYFTFYDVVHGKYSEGSNLAHLRRYIKSLLKRCFRVSF